MAIRQNLRRALPRRAALAGSVLCLALAGCASGSGSGSSGGTITLTYLTHFNQKPGQDIEKNIVTAFEKSHPGIKINVLAMQSGTEFTKYQTLASAGSPPDVFLADSGTMQSLLAHNVLAPVDYKSLGATSASFANQYIPGVFDGYIREGITYGIPEEYSNYGAWVNAKAFSNAGLTVPTTWDQVCQDGPKLLKTQNGKVVGEEIVLPTNLSASQVFLLDAISREYGSPLFNATGTKSYLTSQATIQALTMLQRLVYDCHASVPSLNSSTQGADRLVYGAGQADMLLTGGAWYLGTLQQQYPKIAPPVSVASQYPTVPGAQPTSESYGYAWVVPKAGSHQQAAWEFIKALSDAGGTYFSQMGLFNGKTSVASSQQAAKTPYWNTAWQPSLRAAHYAVGLNNSSQIDDIIGNAIDQIILQHANVASTLASADQQVTPLLNQA